MEARYCMNCGAELGPAEAFLCFYCEEYERDQKKREAEMLKELEEKQDKDIFQFFDF